MYVIFILLDLSHDGLKSEIYYTTSQSYLHFVSQCSTPDKISGDIGLGSDGWRQDLYPRKSYFNKKEAISQI